MFFIKPSENDLTHALEAWQWLPIAEKEPIIVTAFGDIFFSSTDGIWFLDTLEGSLIRVCESEDEIRGILKSEDGENHYLFAGFVERAIHDGQKLATDQCYDFVVNPIVGGKVEYENIQRQNFVVSVNVAGQLHEQVKDLPDGTPITGFTINEPAT